MIVSHKHKFIFIKTQKTASGACELALGRLCGEEDIIKSDADPKKAGLEDLTERNNQRVIPSAKNFTKSFVHQWRKKTLPNPIIAYNYSLQKFHSPHIPAKEAKKILGRNVWDSYYKFCFERNPFDRLVSLYYWRTKGMEKPPTFKEFAYVVCERKRSKLRKYNARHHSNQPLYKIGGEIAVDKVCMFEDLEGELKKVSDHLGLGWDGWLLHTKGNFRPKSKEYREYYDEDLRRACEKAFAYEMKKFGYRF